MTIEQQVCTREQSEKLVILGVATNTSYFEYCQKIGRDVDVYIRVRPYIDTADFKITSPAFTVAELGVMIDWNFTSATAPYKEQQVWMLSTDNYDEFNTNEAIARAAILIYLLENNITTAEQVNKRLCQ